MNRVMRRMQAFGKSLSARRLQEQQQQDQQSADTSGTLFNDDRQQQDLSVRAKNTGHGKKTADKWNQ